MPHHCVSRTPLWEGLATYCAQFVFDGQQGRAAHRRCLCKLLLPCLVYCALCFHSLQEEAPPPLGAFAGGLFFVCGTPIGSGLQVGCSPCAGVKDRHGGGASGTEDTNENLVGQWALRGGLSRCSWKVGGFRHGSKSWPAKLDQWEPKQKRYNTTPNRSPVKLPACLLEHKIWDTKNVSHVFHICHTLLSERLKRSKQLVGNPQHQLLDINMPC